MKKFLVLVIALMFISRLPAAELVLSYDFEGDTTDVVTDKSGNGINGVLREFNVSGQTRYQGTGINGTNCLVTNANMGVLTNKGRSVTYLPAGFSFGNEATFVLRLKRYPTIQGVTPGAESVSVPLGWYTDPANSVRGLYVRNSVHSTGAGVDSIMLYEYAEWLRYPNIMLPPDGEWHFVVVRLSSSLGIYVRVDESLYTNTADKRSIGNCAILMLGNRLQVDNPFSGEFDDIRVYKGAMTDAQIEQMYQDTFKAQSPYPADGSLNVDTNLPQISWTMPVDTVCNAYIGIEEDMSDAVQLLADSSATSADVSLSSDTTYYWRVDIYDANDIEITGNVWTFQTAKSSATEPYPAVNATGLPLNTQLSWLPGIGSQSHNVYISSNLSEVENRTAAVNTTNNSLWATNLEFNTTYYWVVDEVNSSTTYLGDIWSFTTKTGSDVIEAFSYATENEFKLVWSGDANDPNLVSGRMKIHYSDAAATYTKTFADVDFGFSDAWVLTVDYLFVQEDYLIDAPQLSVELLDSSDNVVFSGIIENTQTGMGATYSTCKLSLADYKESLSAVRKIRFAMEGYTAGEGYVMIDNIVFAESFCESTLSGDLNGDCIVGIEDLFYFAAAWLDDVENFNYNAAYMGTVPTIDGTLSAGEWSGAASYNLSYPAVLTRPFNGSRPSTWGAPVSAADLSADIYMGWDNDYIYIAVRVYDDVNVWKSNTGPYNGQDTLQLCLSPFGFAGTFNPDDPAATASIIDFVPQTLAGTGADFYGRGVAAFSNPANIIVAGSDLTDGYILEIKILNSGFGLTPAVGETIKMGLILLDMDASSPVGFSDTGTNGVWDVGNTASWNNFVFTGSN